MRESDATYTLANIAGMLLSACAVRGWVALMVALDEATQRVTA